MEYAPSDLSLLLVEPSATQRKIIISELEKEDIKHITQASSVKEAIELLEGASPDLIASAMYFDDGTAKDIIHKVRTGEIHEDVPFMLVSSEWRREQLEEYKQAGVVAILPKPFTREHLGMALNATIDLLAYDELELELFDVTELRVLLVDDSALARRFIGKVLHGLGIRHLTQATDGQEAINIMEEQMFDLVVTDYNMPNVDGRQLTEHIRNNSNQSHVPVLMVSSEANETHLSNIEQAGVNAMCDKPFEPQTVKGLLYQLLGD